MFLDIHVYSTLNKISTVLVRSVKWCDSDDVSVGGGASGDNEHSTNEIRKEAMKIPEDKVPRHQMSVLYIHSLCTLMSAQCSSNHHHLNAECHLATAQKPQPFSMQYPSVAFSLLPLSSLIPNSP